MQDDYAKARKAGLKQVRADVAAGRYPYPPALDDLLADGRGSGEVPLGVREIPLELVVGTKNHARANMFSQGFLPIAEEGTEFASKWCDLYEAQMTEGIREPIVVCEYLQRFYVQEGNKRVSVLRSLGVPTVLASITRIMPKPSGDREVRCYREFVELYRVVPVYGLVFSEEGSCRALADLLGHDLAEPWPEDEVRALTTTLSQFVAAYRARGGDLLPMTVGDAFLLYVRAYATSSPLRVTSGEMDSRVARLWGELVVSAQDGVAYVERVPQERGGIIPLVKGVTKGRKRSAPLKAAFIYDRTPADSGWVALHEKGRLDLLRHLEGEVDASALYGRADDASFERAVDAALEDGRTVIVTASPRQMEQTRRAAVAHPDAVFINCSLNLSSRAVRTFYARMYEVKFLLGALAASMAQNHRVGYLANSPIYGSVAEINAFAIGVSMVDPSATVHLKWIAAEKYDWLQELRDDDVRVLAGRDYPNPLDEDEPYGLSCLHADGSVERVATPVWDWGRCYELIVRAIRGDSWRRDASEHRDRAINYWWGISEGVVRLEVCKGFSNGPLRLLQTLERDLVEGRLHPFEDMLVAQEGVVVQGAGSPRLSNEELASMRWLNGNVVGRLPKSWELSQDGHRAVAVSGVIGPDTDSEDN